MPGSALKVIDSSRSVCLSSRRSNPFSANDGSSSIALGRNRSSPGTLEHILATIRSEPQSKKSGIYSDVGSSPAISFRRNRSSPVTIGNIIIGQSKVKPKKSSKTQLNNKYHPAPLDTRNEEDVEGTMRDAKEAERTLTDTDEASEGGHKVQPVLNDDDSMIAGTTMVSRLVSSEPNNIEQIPNPPFSKKKPLSKALLKSIELFSKKPPLPNISSVDKQLLAEKNQDTLKSTNDAAEEQGATKKDHLKKMKKKAELTANKEARAKEKEKMLAELIKHEKAKEAGNKAMEAAARKEAIEKKAADHSAAVDAEKKEHEKKKLMKKSMARLGKDARKEEKERTVLLEKQQRKKEEISNKVKQSAVVDLELALKRDDMRKDIDDLDILRKDSTFSILTNASVLTEYNDLPLLLPHNSFVGGSNSTIADDSTKKAGNGKEKESNMGKGKINKKKNAGKTQKALVEDFLDATTCCGLMSLFERWEDNCSQEDKEGVLLNEIDDIEKCLAKHSRSISRSRHLNLLGTQTIPQSAPDEIKMSYHHAVSRAAVLNAKMELRKAELELKKIELESWRVDDDINHMMDRSYDEESIDSSVNGIDMEDGLFGEFARTFY